jgi:hypothetical protein
MMMYNVSTLATTTVKMNVDMLTIGTMVHTTKDMYTNNTLHTFVLATMLLMIML